MRGQGFAFIAPLARALGMLQLGERLPASFLAAALRVAAGIARFSARRT